MTEIQRESKRKLYQQISRVRQKYTPLNKDLSLDVEYSHEMFRSLRALFSLY